MIEIIINFMNFFVSIVFVFLNGISTYLYEIIESIIERNIKDKITIEL